MNGSSFRYIAVTRGSKPCNKYAYHKIGIAKSARGIDLGPIQQKADLSVHFEMDVSRSKTMPLGLP